MRNSYNRFRLIIIRKSKRWYKEVVFAACILFLFVLLCYRYDHPRTKLQANNEITASNNNGGCLVSFGTYRGPTYVSEEFTRGTPKCLVQSKWLRLVQHSVQLTASSKVISDWLWIDYHERINVLVEAPYLQTNNHHERHWLLFRQQKYALEGGVSSLAIVGGTIEPGETSHQAAIREMEEELHVTCQLLMFLGRFRTDVNRGMGYTNSYVAMDCLYMNSTKRPLLVVSEEEVGLRDQEPQDIVTMTTTKVREAVQNGKFLEVQWSNTVALAMMHSDVRTNPPPHV